MVCNANYGISSFVLCGIYDEQIYKNIIKGGIFMNKIITISREFGSGGRELGRRLSEELNIAYYDQEIISEISKRTKLAEWYVEQIIEQKQAVTFPIHIGRSFHPLQNPVFDLRQVVLLEQHRIIKELAEKSECVIVGRCADYILQDYQPFRIFVYADMESKIIRCRKHTPADEHLTDKELKHQISLIDKNRAKYYNDYTGQKWGYKLNYDLCINTTNTTIKGIMPALSKLFL